MGATERLAQWIADTAFDDIPTEAFAQAKKSILDYIGTAIHGSTTDLGRMIVDLTREQGGNPQARVIASDIRTSTASAAPANGTMGHAADFYYLGRGIGGLRSLFAVNAVRRHTQALILAFSVAYNVLAVGLAVIGHMNPLVAAILMPVNSLLTLALVTGGMRRAFTK